MQRNQWILAGTAGVLGMGALAIGAVSVANAMTVQDASGRPITGVEIRGDAAGDATDAAAGKAIVLGILAPTPSEAAPSAAAPAPAPAEQPAPAPAPAPAPVQPPVPAPAPVAPADSVSAASAG